MALWRVIFFKEPFPSFPAGFKIFLRLMSIFWNIIITSPKSKISRHPVLLLYWADCVITCGDVRIIHQMLVSIHVELVTVLFHQREEVIIDWAICVKLHSKNMLVPYDSFPNDFVVLRVLFHSFSDPFHLFVALFNEFFITTASSFCLISSFRWLTDHVFGIDKK